MIDHDAVRRPTASTSGGRDGAASSLSNDGKLMHEFVIGTKAGTRRARCADEEVSRTWSTTSRTWPTSPPGKTGEIVWTFNRAGEFDFACLIAGHYEAGMVGRITVNGRAAALQSQ